MSVPEDVRQKLALAIPGTPVEIAELLAKYVRELQDAGAASTVPNQQALIPVLAADMKRKAGGTGSDAEWHHAAKQQIEGNQTTALTTSDDRYTGIEGGAKFDEIHELIHICSAKGGESTQHTFKLQFNEGAINYFSELVAPKLGSNVVTRYATETDLVKKLVKLIGSPDGSKKLFGSTFQGKIDDFFLAVGVAYRKLGDKQPDGKNKGPGDKAYTTDQAAGKEFQSKVKNWSEGWLKARLPTLP